AAQGGRRPAAGRAIRAGRATAAAAAAAAAPAAATTAAAVASPLDERFLSRPGGAGEQRGDLRTGSQLTSVLAAVMRGMKPRSRRFFDSQPEPVIDESQNRLDRGFIQIGRAHV